MSKPERGELSSDSMINAILNESRDPLETIRQLSQGLLEGLFGDLTADQRKAVGTIRDRAQRLVELMAVMREYSRKQ